MGKSGPACIKCGMCCMVAVCGYGEDLPRGPTGECGYLTIADDDDAICTCEEAMERFVGSGCIFQATSFAEVYLLHLNEYNIDIRRETLKEEGYG